MCLQVSCTESIKKWRKITTTKNQIQSWPFIYKPGEHRQQSKGKKTHKITSPMSSTECERSNFCLKLHPPPLDPPLQQTISKWNRIKNPESEPILWKSYTESNESLKIKRLRNPIVCSGIFLKQTQAYIYIRLIASGIDKIHNCPKCLKVHQHKWFSENWLRKLDQFLDTNKCC